VRVTLLGRGVMTAEKRTAMPVQRLS